MKKILALGALLLMLGSSCFAREFKVIKGSIDPKVTDITVAVHELTAANQAMPLSMWQAGPKLKKSIQLFNKKIGKFIKLKNIPNTKKVGLIITYHYTGGAGTTGVQTLILRYDAGSGNITKTLLIPADAAAGALN